MNVIHDPGAPNQVRALKLFLHKKSLRTAGIAPRMLFGPSSYIATRDDDSLTSPLKKYRVNKTTVVKNCCVVFQPAVKKAVQTHVLLTMLGAWERQSTTFPSFLPSLGTGSTAPQALKQQKHCLLLCRVMLHLVQVVFYPLAILSLGREFSPENKESVGGEGRREKGGPMAAWE